MVECPKCGAKVRKDKLRRHINAVHTQRRASEEIEESAPSGRGSTVQFPWRVFAVLGVVALVVIAGYWYVSQQGGGSGGGPPPTGNVAVIDVANFGTIKVQLDTVRAPKTAGNFITLASQGKYDHNSFNRICAGFVIQGGDVAGAAAVPWEFTGLLNAKYTIAMARVGDANNASYKDTATSQFFINLADNHNLDRYNPTTNPTGVQYEYVVFGKVTDASSQSVVDAIARVSAGPSPSCPPYPPPTITSITIQ